MTVTSAKPVLWFLSPLRLTGPLFDKELRVSSRRRRNYALRFVYVILLTFFVATVWLGVVESQYSAVYQKSRMAVAGKTIITTIVWFQFVATQLLAVIMLSVSISDEIHHRTLGLLMTTPIDSLQIVMGKLFSKLLQIILLLAISLPLLAVVRVFGGVPADYLFSSLCMTLTAVIFAGSVSLFFSINNRKAYVVIIKTVVALGVLYAFVPAIAGTIFGARYIGRLGPPNITAWPFVVFLHLNPFGAMSINTAMMMSPTAPTAMPFFYWPAHCMLMLVASALVISVSVKIVRKVALRQATGQIDLLPKRRAAAKRRKKTAAQPAGQSGVVRRVKGSPVLAIVRIFGGVPWGYVVSSLCITLTAVIFAGSVSLFFSVFSRRAYLVIILSCLTVGISFGLFSALSVEIFGHPWGRRGGIPIPLYLNPYMLLGFNTDVMISPRMAGRPSVSLIGHCGIMLAASACILFGSSRLVRRIALTQTTGGAGVFTRLWQMRPKKSAKESKYAGRIRRVTGPAVMWKELITRRSRLEKIFVTTIIGTELIMIAAMYAFPLVVSMSSMEEAHTLYVGVFIGLGMLSVTVFPATCIASEKEARSWPLLLTTAVSDWEIVLGKFVGVLKRSLPVWLILIVYLIPYWGIIAFGVIEVAALVIGTTVFLCGTGLYVSSRARRTNTAVAANFVVAASLWGILHFTLAFLNPTTPVAFQWRASARAP